MGSLGFLTQFSHAAAIGPIYPQGMSGAEVPPVVGAVNAAQAASKALGVTDDERHQLAAIAAEHPAMKRAADSYAKNLATRVEIIRRLYSPVAWMMGLRGDWLDEELPDRLAEKLADVPQESLKTPEPNILGPSLQGLAYNLDNRHIREAYINLIAAATDSRRESEAHPAFAEVLKQLAPTEAKSLIGGLRRGSHTAVQVWKVQSDKTYTIAITHLLNWTTGVPDDLEFREDGTVVIGERVLGLNEIQKLIFESRMMPSERSSVWVENWVRLGLMNVTYEEDAVRSYGAYLSYQGHPEIEALKRSAKPDEEIKVVRGVMSATAFGKLFFSAISGGEVSGSDVPDIRAPHGSQAGPPV